MNRLVKNKQKLFLIMVMIVASWQLGSGAYIHVKAYVAQQLLMSAWQRTLDGEKNVKPWSWADTWPIARMQVPAYDKDIIILAGDSGRNLAFGPGYRFGTAEPGTPGVSVISAHRDTHFRFLKDLKTGDDIKIQTKKGETILYKVTSAIVVEKSSADIELNINSKQLVLVTCYPFNSISPNTRLRYLVYAQAAATII